MFIFFLINKYLIFILIFYVSGKSSSCIITDEMCSVDNFPAVVNINSSVNKIINHLSDKSPENVCFACNKSYKWRSGLRKHLKYECGKEPQFQCPMCSKKCKLKENLKKHFIHCHSSSI